MPGESVRLEGVGKTYENGVVAVKDMTLTLAAGEFTTLLGPSGSGKTSTLMMIAGFETPTKGEIYIGERPVARTPPHLRNLGMVFQNYALFPHMTVGQNIGYPLRMRKLAKAKIRAAIEKALQLVQLEGYENRAPAQLSGGQQQRVALARATVFEPPVLLMDEPLGALDRKLRQAMQFELKQIHRTLGVTVVSVTHDQEEALTMSDRIVVMRDGQIEQVGTPDEIYERPKVEFVADFIGEANILRGAIGEGANGGLDLVTESGVRVPLRESGVTSGQRAAIAIRPERVRIDPVGQADPRATSYSGVIHAFTYAGDMTRIEVLVEGKVPLIAKASSTERAVKPEEGLNVAVSWSPDAVVVLSD